MEITLEAIELVKDRTGVTYKEAKEALEAADGNVVNAIISIEEKINQTGTPGKFARKADVTVAQVKDLIKKGNVNKLTIKKNDEVILNLPINIGIIGTILFPWAGVASTIAAFGTKCTVELTKDNGETIDVTKKAGEIFDAAKSKGSVIVDEAKDKGAELFNAATDKGSDILNAAKEKVNEFRNRAASKETDFEAKFEDAVDDIAENVEDLAEDIAEELKPEE